MINYSIVIPHYNIPSLLERCIDSIPLRDDVEIIVVDDNSSPDKVDFTSFPGINRDNCRVILDKKGGGGGYARNIALNYIRGKWVIFADADDFFTPCFADVLDEYINDDGDVIFCNACSLDAEYYVNSSRAAYLNKYINIYKHNPSKGELCLRYRFTEPWCKIVKVNLLKRFSIRFDETPVANDVTFSYLVGYYAEKVSVDAHAIYCVTMRKNSVSEFDYRVIEKIETRINVHARKSLFFQQHNIPILEERHFWHVLVLFFKTRNIKNVVRGIRILKQLGYSNNNVIVGLFKGFFTKMWDKVRHRYIILSAKT